MNLNIFKAAKYFNTKNAVIVNNDEINFEKIAKLTVVFFDKFNKCKQGEIIAIKATNTIATICALYGLMASNTPFVPIHPKITKKEEQLIVDNAKPAMVLDDNDLQSIYHNQPVTEKCSINFDDKKFIAIKKSDDNDPLAIVYTSGSSGTPKGAILSRRALIASALGSENNLGWKIDDIWLLCLPLCHVGGFSIIIRCLLAGKPLCLVDKFDPNVVLKKIEKNKATLLSVVPTMLNDLLDVDKNNLLAQLRAILVGGAFASKSLLKRCEKQQIQALVTYGLTEASSQVAIQKPIYPPKVQNGVGQVIRGTTVEIVENDGIKVKHGKAGTIRLYGATLMNGYLGEKLNGAYFDTNDVGYLDKNEVLHICGRREDFIITGGENVYPAEVENIITSYKSVELAIVFGIKDKKWGQTIAVAILPKKNKQFLLNEFAAFLKEHLASFKKPRKMALLNVFETLPTGKINKKKVIENAKKNMFDF